jgi:OmpR family two-component system bacitracin resistance response regulator BceR
VIIFSNRTPQDYNEGMKGCAADMDMNIFIVEDDSAIFNSLKERLGQWSFHVSGPEDFHDVMKSFIQAKPHLVILDIQLPAYDGFHWCREIRAVSKVPIIFLSSRDHPMDMVMAMNMGADDYIQKPFHTDVLLAKIQATLRRTYAYTDEAADVLEWNGAMIDMKRGIIRLDGNEVELTKNEFFILTVLVQAKDEIVSRDDLIRKLWDDERFVNDNTLTVNVTRLRQKLADIGLGDAILTKKGLGYMAVSL